MITDTELSKIIEDWHKEQPINIGIKTAFAAGYRVAELKNCNLQNVSGSVLFANWIAKKMQADSWFRYNHGRWYVHTKGHLTTEELYELFLNDKN